LDRVVGPDELATRTSSTADIRRRAREVGARYAVVGQVSMRDGVRVASAKLFDTRTSIGETLWADEVPTSSAPGVGRLVAGIYEEIIVSDKALARAVPPASEHVAEAVLYAQQQYGRASNDADKEAAKSSLREVMRLHPDYPPAAAGLALMYFYEAWWVHDNNAPPLLQEADGLAAEALSLVPGYSEAWTVRVGSLLRQKKHEVAVSAADEALAANPYYTSLIALRGRALLYLGRIDEAERAFGASVAMNPRSRMVGELFVRQCEALLYLGRYQDAIASCERAEAAGESWEKYLYLTALYSNIESDGSQAKRYKEKLLAMRPHQSIFELRFRRLSYNSNYLFRQEEHLYPGLRKAGIPEY
jgi:tetratricopeptide (TPR) repeat protein